MRERGVTLLLALGALLAFYAIWLRPSPTFGGGDVRPTSSERRGNGYAALTEWLEKSGVPVRSYRDRYTRLADLDVPSRGNLLVLTLPGLEVFHNDEFGALDKWLRRGNTLLVNAALMDQPDWAAGRESGTVAEIESLAALEFETREAREARLDDTPLAQRVRERDAREAKSGEEESEDDGQTDDTLDRRMDEPGKIVLNATGPHPLLDGVRKLSFETDYLPKEWSLRLPYDNFVLTLARAQYGEGAVFEQRHGNGRILLVAGGTLLSNRALGHDDNARFMANVVAGSLGPGGAVLFDDLRQGLSANYDSARLYKDPRLYKTIGIVMALWLAWVLGSTRLRAPAVEGVDPSEADLVRHAGGFIARAVRPWQTAMRLFDQFFARVARAARGASGVPDPDRGELWHWLERHAAILPHELDQLKTWYADAHAERKLPLVPLQNLLDQLERRLKT